MQGPKCATVNVMIVGSFHTWGIILFKIYMYNIVISSVLLWYQNKNGHWAVGIRTVNVIFSAWCAFQSHWYNRIRYSNTLIYSESFRKQQRTVSGINSDIQKKNHLIISRNFEIKKVLTNRLITKYLV